jgi:hypothetical protein
MSKKKNIQASNQNVINSQDGVMNSMNGSHKGGNINVNSNPSNDFEQKQNSGMQPGLSNTKDKK